MKKLEQLGLGFAQKSRLHSLREAIGALDGCFIWQKNLGDAIDNSNSYYCARMEKFSLLLMAIADADRRFIWFVIRCTPTTHDLLAWLMTDRGQRVENGELPSSFSILWDSALCAP